MHRSRSHHPVIRVYDDAGNVIETHEHAGDFKEPWQLYRLFRNCLRRRFAQLPLRTYGNGNIDSKKVSSLPAPHAKKSHPSASLRTALARQLTVGIGQRLMF
jgi:hypothetical protein